MDWLKIRGGSMRPLLFEGDEVGVEWESRSPRAGVRAGELVVFRGEGGEWIVHRVIGTRPIVTKGDAAYCVERVAPDAIWGRVVALRSARTGRESGLGRHWLDGVIAGVSRRAAGQNGLVSKLEFRLVLALGAARRLLARGRGIA